MRFRGKITNRSLSPFSKQSSNDHVRRCMSRSTRSNARLGSQTTGLQRVTRTCSSIIIVYLFNFHTRRVHSYVQTFLWTRYIFNCYKSIYIRHSLGLFISLWRQYWRVYIDGNRYEKDYFFDKQDIKNSFMELIFHWKWDRVFYKVDKLACITL